MIIPAFASFKLMRERDALHEAAHAVTAERLVPGSAVGIRLDCQLVGVPELGWSAGSCYAVFLWSTGTLFEPEDRAVMTRASRFVDNRWDGVFEGDDRDFFLNTLPHRRGTLAAKARRIVLANRPEIIRVAKAALAKGELTGDEIREAMA